MFGSIIAEEHFGKNITFKEIDNRQIHTYIYTYRNIDVHIHTHTAYLLTQ